MSETAIKTPKSKSIHGLEPEYLDKFNNLKEQCGYTSDARFLQDLLDRFENPQRVEDRTRQLEEELQAKVDRIAQLEKELEQAQATIVTMEQDLAQARAAADNTAKQAQDELAEYRAAHDLRPDEYRVVILPDNLKALDFVCARESRRRNQQWSRSHVINHFIYNRFILGNCNGDLQSISDADCRKLGISMKSRNSERGTRNTASPVAEPVEATAETQPTEKQEKPKYEL